MLDGIKNHLNRLAYGKYTSEDKRYIIRDILWCISQLKDK